MRGNLMKIIKIPMSHFAKIDSLKINKIDSLSDQFDKSTHKRIKNLLKSVEDLIGDLMKREESSMRQGDYCSIITMLDDVKKLLDDNRCS